MERPRFQGSHRREHQVEITDEAARGFEIVVERDYRVTEAIAKMIDYANHAKRHAADPETREDMENVLAHQGRRCVARCGKGCHRRSN